MQCNPATRQERIMHPCQVIYSAEELTNFPQMHFITLSACQRWIWKSPLILLKSLAQLGAHWDGIKLPCGTVLKRKACVGDLSLYSRRHFGMAQPFVSVRVKILYRRSEDYLEALSERLTLSGISVWDSAAKRKGCWVNKTPDRGLGLCCNGLMLPSTAPMQFQHCSTKDRENTLKCSWFYQNWFDCNSTVVQHIVSPP